MNKPPFGVPGIQGSLGQCAYCGKPFLLEILLGTKIRTFELDGIANSLCAHDDCFEKYSKLDDWRKLPNGPLRTVCEQQDAKLAAK